MENIDIIELEKVKSLLKRQSSGVSGTEVTFFYQNVQFEEFQCFFCPDCRRSKSMDISCLTKQFCWQ